MPDEQKGLGSDTNRVRAGFADAEDTERAIHDLLDQLEADTATFTFVFFCPTHNARTVSRVLDRRVDNRGVGGTTGGEISPAGFSIGTMTGLSLHGAETRSTAEVIPNLDELSLVPITQLPGQLAGRIGRSRDELSENRHVWMTIGDNTPAGEDLLTPFFKHTVPSTRLVGGSLVGSDLDASPELVYHGRVYTNATALVLLEYDGPFEVFHHNHLQFTDRRLEVTSVSEKGRILEELDGQPAAVVYASTIGVSPDELDRELAALYPLGFRFRGRPLACSIVDILDRGRLRMANTLHPGETLRLLKTGDLVESTKSALRNALRSFESEHGCSARGALFFNCTTRYVEAQSKGCLPELAKALDQLPFAGFNTYGEQFDALHTNHTLTGILFG